MNAIEKATTVRESFGETEAIVQHETSSTAVAARLQSEVQAKFIVAMQRPRNIDAARQGLLRACERTSFARSARYRKPIGRGVEGPSIRFAEEAVRQLGNIDVQTAVTFDDLSKQIIRVSVSDLESNTTYSSDVVVQKTVERSRVNPGQRVLSQRKNSQGYDTFLVEATDDEILNKVNALVSKAVRTLALRQLPGDILDECMAKCIETARDEDERDPDAARKRLFDAFASVGVPAADLTRYIGHPPSTLSPAEMAELRGLYSAIRDGEATWAEAVDHRHGERADGPPTPPEQDGRRISLGRRRETPKAEAVREHGEEG